MYALNDFSKSTDAVIIYTSKKDHIEYIFSPTVRAIINKFSDIYDVVNEVLESDDTFYELYDDMMVQYFETESEDRLILLLEKLPSVIQYIDYLFETTGFADNMVVVEDSSFKLNININEAYEIMKTSFRTRFFIPIYLSGEYALTDSEQKTFQSIVCENIISKGVFDKLYAIIHAMLLSTGPDKSGKRVWQLFSMTKGYTTSNYIIELMNNVLYKALPSIDPSRNPIAYLITVAKMDMNWLLQTQLTYTCVTANFDDVVTKPKNDVLESEVLYRIIVKNIFTKLAQSYSKYKILYKYSCFNTLMNISQPLVLKVFNMPIYKLNLTNIHVINFFTHNFLKKADENKTLLRKLLLSIPTTNYSYDVDGKIRCIPTELEDFIRAKIDGYSLSKLTGFSNIMLQKMFNAAILSLYKYAYKDPITNVYLDIDWYECVDEFIDYYFKLINGDYIEHIQLQQQEVYY